MITALVQGLEPGSRVELFELDATMLGGDVYRFHAHTHAGFIRWQGEDYEGWPIKADGFEVNGQGRAITPTLAVGNVRGFVTALVLSFNDLVGATLYRRRTLARYLDGMPEADPDEEFPTEQWKIEQKTSEDHEYVQFELSSAIDFQGQLIPARQIIAGMCQWAYRSAECGYTGGPVADINDNPTDNAVLDRCGKRVPSCKMRFGEFNELNHGGFPSAGLVR